MPHWAFRAARRTLVLLYRRRTECRRYTSIPRLIVPDDFLNYSRHGPPWNIEAQVRLLYSRRREHFGSESSDEELAQASPWQRAVWARALPRGRTPPQLVVGSSSEDMPVTPPCLTGRLRRAADE